MGPRPLLLIFGLLFMAMASAVILVGLSLPGWQQAIVCLGGGMLFLSGVDDFTNWFGDVLRGLEPTSPGTQTTPPPGPDEHG